MTALTEPLDRIAQSHIEGRVERVRPAAPARFPWYTARFSPRERIADLGAEKTIERIRSRLADLTISHANEIARGMVLHCAHCNAPYDENAGVFLHVRECPCNQRETK